MSGAAELGMPRRTSSRSVVLFMRRLRILPSEAPERTGWLAAWRRATSMMIASERPARYMAWSSP